MTQGRGDQFTPENDKRFFAEAVKNAKSNPIGSASLIIRKAGRFWFHVYRPDRKAFQWLVALSQAVLLALGMLGAWFAFKDKKGSSLFVVVIIYFNLLHAASVSTFRYSMPVMPFVIMFASYGILRIFKREQSSISSWNY